MKMGHLATATVYSKSFCIRHWCADGFRITYIQNASSQLQWGRNEAETLPGKLDSRNRACVTCRLYEFNDTYWEGSAGEVEATLVKLDVAYDPRKFIVYPTGRRD